MHVRLCIRKCIVPHYIIMVSVISFHAVVSLFAVFVMPHYL